ncbi:MAG: hypothetical protein LBP28_05085, partial [Coriobacteriales bacterium]|nr:hypothetical protein [Coriobacteriales bacterium]
LLVLPERRLSHKLDLGLIRNCQIGTVTGVMGQCDKRHAERGFATTAIIGRTVFRDGRYRFWIVKTGE